MGDTATATDHTSIIKIADGHPILAVPGHLSLDLAAAASGISADYLLRCASEGRLRLFWRSAGTPGYLVHRSELQPDDSELGSVIVPPAARMPTSAMRLAPVGMLQIPLDALPGVVDALLHGPGHSGTLVAFDAAQPGQLFVPDVAVEFDQQSVEVAALDVEALRRPLAATILPAHLEAARAAHSAPSHSAPGRAAKHDQKLLSEALAAYTKNKLRNTIASDSEVNRRSAACRLLVELAGDKPVGGIDADSLRLFRDEQLSRIPAHENKVRLQYGTRSVSESMAAVAGTNWPVMSPGERNKRIEWIRAWFSWLKAQGWIGEDPGAAIAGESVLTAAASRAIRKREDQNREVFRVEHLHTLFASHIARTGKSRASSSGKRTDSPVEYWLPLLGLYTGARIGELCQLHLSDFGQTANGTWFIDFNERTPDKRLKTPKVRSKMNRPGFHGGQLV